MSVFLYHVCRKHYVFSAFYYEGGVLFMARTINGKPVDEVMKALLEPLPERELEYKYENQNFPYFPYDSYINRLNSTVGVLNYDYLCGESKLEFINGSPFLRKTGTLIIYDDERKVVKMTKAGAGHAVIVANDSGNVTNFNNDENRLDRNLLGNLLKTLDIGRAQLSEIREKKSGKNSSSKQRQQNKPATVPKNRAATVSTDTQPESRRYTIIFNRALTAMSTGYKTEVSLEDGNVCELVIFKEGIASIEKFMPMRDFSAQVKPKVQVNIGAYPHMYRDKEQLIMTDLYRE